MRKKLLEVIYEERKIYCVDENLDIDAAIKLVEWNKIKEEADRTEIHLAYYDFLDDYYEEEKSENP